MELRDFVSETLVQIVKGIESANASLAPDKEQPFKLGYSGGDRPQAPHIEFDVAVTTQVSKAAQGKAKLVIVEFGLFGSISKSKESVSRVKFSVLVK